MQESGKELKMLKQKEGFTVPTDPSSLVHLPTDSKIIMSIVSCARCTKLLSPVQYYICKKNGHHICGECALIQLSTSLPPSYTSKFGLFSSTSLPNLEACCSATENLVQGPQHLMEILLKNSKWDCKFQNNGCKTTVLGSDWESHINNCKFGYISICKIPECVTQLKSRFDAVKHYVGLHEKKLHNGPKSNFNVPFGTLYFQKGPMIEIIKWENDYYLFGAKNCGGTVYASVWDMQTINDIDADITARYYLTIRAQDADKTATINGNCVPYSVKAERGKCKDFEGVGIPYSDIEKLRWCNYPSDKSSPYTVFELELTKI